MKSGELEENVMDSQPLLSVCIPTYNRAAWLRKSLEAWIPQIQKSGFLVELVVSDNCSDDSTPQVVREAQKLSPFRYHRNSINIGGNPNFHKCAELANGKFVWVVGDDDLPRRDALARVLIAIQNHSDLKLFYVNQILHNTKQAPDASCIVDDLSPGCIGLNPDHHDRYLLQLKDLMPGDFSCFCSIYSSIMPREDAIAAFAGSLGQEPFTNVASVSSHAIYVADHFLNKPAYYIGFPCLVISTDASWPQYSPIFHLEILPEIYDYFEQAGVPRQVMALHRKRILAHARPLLWAMKRDKKTFGYSQFCLKKYAARHWRFREFHILMIKNLVRAATPSPIRKVVDLKLAERQFRRSMGTENS